MKKVTIKLNGVYIGSTEMTVEEIRKAENSGFTIISKVNL